MILTRIAKKLKNRKKTRALFYKALVFLIEIYAMVLLGFSYYLAYLDKAIVLEELSKTLVKAIIYPFIAFTINRTVENFSEHNITSFHKPLDEEEGEG